MDYKAYIPTALVVRRNTEGLFSIAYRTLKLSYSYRSPSYQQLEDLFMDIVTIKTSHRNKIGLITARFPPN